MLSYTGGRGLGSMGAKSVLEVNFRNENSANKLVTEIKTMKPKKPKKVKKKQEKVNNESKELDDIDFDGLADMVNESNEHVSGIFETRDMDANDVLTSIEHLIPKSMIRDKKISLATEFVNRIFDSYKSKYGDKIKGNKNITRKINYHSGIYD